MPEKPENPESVKQTPNHYLRAVGIEPVDGYKERSVDFIDPAPKPFIVQIPLVEYFERMKRLKARHWQQNFLQRLEDSAVNRHIARTWTEIHAEGQIGKTICFQAFMAWIIGHYATARIALAMYNVMRSQSHSQVVLQLLQNPIHQHIFPDKNGWLCPDAQAKSGWVTQARRELNDGQLSLNPVGLQSGLTGNGADFLIFDDPYKDKKEAFSEQVRRNMKDFWDYTVLSRDVFRSNIYAMFHRYSPDDFGGYLLDTGQFDYWRYATECDGEYIHEATGQKFDDPLGRGIGEYILPEDRPPAYYAQVKKNPLVWFSMNQGRPTSEEGEFFKVGFINELEDAEFGRMRSQCIAFARAWDTAATQDAGDYTAGFLQGITPSGDILWIDLKYEQVDTARRVKLQQDTAEEDGLDTVIVIPEERAGGGKDNVYFTREQLKGYTVKARSVVNAAPGSTAKTRRAYNLSVTLNSGKVYAPKSAPWLKDVKRRFRNFPLSDEDHDIDAASDGHNDLYETYASGRVIKISPVFQPRKEFAFGRQIPAHWTVYVAVKMAALENAPNSGVIVARAAQNSGLIDTLFIVDEYKEQGKPYEHLFTWLDASLKKHIALPKDAKESRPNATIWLHPDSEEYTTAIRQKLKYNVRPFEEEGGIVEANWYAQNSKLIGLGDLPNVKQEAATWGFDKNGEPTKIGQVWDCLRMICYQFKTFATSETPREKFERNMVEKGLALEVINEVESEADKLALLQVRTIENRAFVEAQNKQTTYHRSRMPGRFRRK